VDVQRWTLTGCYDGRSLASYSFWLGGWQSFSLSLEQPRKFSQHSANDERRSTIMQTRDSMILVIILAEVVHQKY